MKQDSVRTTVDIPAPLYRKLKQRAAAKGSSVRQLVITGVKSCAASQEEPLGEKSAISSYQVKGTKSESDQRTNLWRD